MFGSIFHDIFCDIFDNIYINLCQYNSIHVCIGATPLTGTLAAEPQKSGPVLARPDQGKETKKRGGFTKCLTLLFCADHVPFNPILISHCCVFCNLF